MTGLENSTVSGSGHRPWEIVTHEGQYLPDHTGLVVSILTQCVFESTKH